MYITSILKRVKITKRGKFLHKYCGQDHFNAKDSTNKIKNKRKEKKFSKVLKKILKNSLSC